MDITVRFGVWLFPVTFVLHVMEEWPGFTDWARKHDSHQFTQRNYKFIHIAEIVVSVVAAVVVSAIPNRAVVFIFFAVVFAPALLFNALFHVGATLLRREYCPGVVTGVTLYVPVFFFISHLALRESLLDATSWTAALVIAAAFHAWEVGHNVFKVW